MPIVTITVRKPKSDEFKSAVFDAVHSGLVASGVPEEDRFHRVLELEKENFRFDPRYPDVTSDRSDNFVIIEILLSVGRSVKIKRKILQDILAGLSRSPGLNPEHVMIYFNETAWENWSFAGGRLIHA